MSSEIIHCAVKISFDCTVMNNGSIIGSGLQRPIFEMSSCKQVRQVKINFLFFVCLFLLRQ